MLLIREGLDERKQCNDLGSGLLLSLRIPIADLRDGLHRVGVGVVDGRGQKINQSVAFFAADGEPKPPPPSRPSPGAGAIAPPEPIHLPDPAGTQKPANPKQSKTAEMFPT